jgi:hypothetical protein
VHFAYKASKKPTLGHKKSALRRFFATFRFGSGFLAADTAAETLLEPIDTTAGVHNLLLASVKWVALGAYVQLKIVAHGGTGLDHVTARTGGGNVFVLRVNTFFHGEPLSVMPLPDHPPRNGLHARHRMFESIGKTVHNHARPETDRESY